MDFLSENKRIETIGTIKGFVEDGYIPSRGTQAYTYTGKFINSFEHAFLNLTNWKIEEMLRISRSAGNIFTKINGKNGEKMTIPQVEQNMYELAEEIGLKVLDAQENPLKLAKNQWQLALYLNPVQCHFAIQEKNGSWSAKEDWAYRVKRFVELPKYYPSEAHVRNPFILQKSYIITNPYAESE